jgi:hypothetical protein
MTPLSESAESELSDGARMIIQFAILLATERSVVGVNILEFCHTKPTHRQRVPIRRPCYFSRGKTN